MALSTRSSPPKCGSGRIHKSRPKCLNQVELGPNPMTTQRFRTQTDLRSSVHLQNDVPEQQKPEPSQSQADRPRRGRPASNYLYWSHATTTDFRKESRASTQRRWPDGRIPRRTTWRPLVISLGVKDKHNYFTCVQPMLSSVLTVE